MVPEHFSTDQARHPHAAQAPEPPPAYTGAVLGRGRARDHSGPGGGATASLGDERRRNQRVIDSDVLAGSHIDDRQPLSPSPNVSTQFTSDISLASSGVTSYEDNGRPKVCVTTWYRKCVYCTIKIQ